MTTAIPRIALVDDDSALLGAWAESLERRYNVRTYDDPLLAHHSFEQEPFEVVVLDLEMPGCDSLSLLRHLRRVQPGAEAIIVSELATANEVVTTMRLGASDFLSKPIRDIEALVRSVEEALVRVKAQNLYHGKDPSDPSDSSTPLLYGESPAMQRVRMLIDRFAPSNLPALILGASGTGKELAARALHARGPRAQKPFVAINCAGLSETLIDSELFGYERGAFTGALSSHKGLFDAADGGTLFLDEIGDVPPPTQVRLLRTLQEGEVRPVGATKCHHVDVRVVSATNIDLKRAIAEGRFREDLYFRLSPIKIELPPLRERGGDIMILAEHLLAACARRARRPVPQISSAAMDALVSYEWPGNVRELRSAIEYAVSLARGQAINLEDLPPSVGFGHRSQSVFFAAEPQAQAPANYMKSRKQLLAEFDRWYFERLLRYTSGNLSEASRRSGVDRSNLRKILREVGISAGDFRSEPSQRKLHG